MEVFDIHEMYGIDMESIWNQYGIKMEYTLIWHSQYGKEEIDTFKTRTEAQRMRTEYQMAYGSGYIEVKRRRVRK